MVLPVRLDSSRNHRRSRTSLSKSNEKVEKYFSSGRFEISSVTYLRKETWSGRRRTGVEVDEGRVRDLRQKNLQVPEGSTVFSSGALEDPMSRPFLPSIFGM